MTFIEVFKVTGTFRDEISVSLVVGTLVGKTWMLAGTVECLLKSRKEET